MADELQSRGLPPHIEEAVRSIADLHAKHQQTATRLQRATAPSHRALLPHGSAPPSLASSQAEQPSIYLPERSAMSRSMSRPFMAYVRAHAWLAVCRDLDYATQRRDDQLTELREQMTLELALLNEQKTAKGSSLSRSSVGTFRSWRTGSTNKRTPWLSQLIRNGYLRQFGKRCRIGADTGAD